MMSSQHVALELEDVEAGSANAQKYNQWWSRRPSFLPAWLGGSRPAASSGFLQLSTDELTTPSHHGEPTRWCPEENAGPVSKALFMWVGSLLRLGGEKTLEPEDLWDVSRRDQATVVSDAFRSQLEMCHSSIARAMWKIHGRKFILAGLIKLAHDCVMFLGPFLLEQLLKDLQAGGGGRRGLWLAFALAGAAVVETLAINIYFHMIFRICLALKTSLVDLLYAKSLRLSSAAKASHGTGAIVNLQSNDAAKLWTIPQYLHMLWSGPLQIVAVMGLLVRVLRPIPAAVGLGVTLALIPLSAFVARALARVRKRVVALTDARVKLCGEVITGVKAIKLYAWEEAYRDRITELRQRELQQIRTALLIGTWNTILWVGGPIVISMAAFLTYTALGYKLTASVAFPALSLFNLLRFPVMMFPTQLTNLVNGKVGLDRLQRFMGAEEMRQPPQQPPSAAPSQPAVSVTSGTFAWGPAAPAVLRDVDFIVRPGQLAIVVGAVGAGKSSLLAALLGELSCLSGEVAVKGGVGYAQQDPWIQNASLRDNVLMEATECDEERYNAVLDACALRPDLEALPAGDATEIGEKGVNLSGGQRARVALARACYAAADVLLLDDPLSAVDAHVGRHLFEKCVLGLLGSTTRILVTHQLQFLPAADLVLVVKDGRIAEQGTYGELAAKGVDFHQYELFEGEEEEEGRAGDDALGGSDGGRDGELAAAANNNKGKEEEEEEEEEEEGFLAEVPLLELAGFDLPLSAEGQAMSAVLKDEATAAADSTAAAAATATARPGSALSSDLEEIDLEDAPLMLSGPSGVFADSSAACATAQTAGMVQPQPQLRQGTTFRNNRPSSPSSSPSAKLFSASPSTAAAKKSADAAAAQLTKAEERSVGRVERRVYYSYFAAWGGPAMLIPGGIAALAVLERGLQSGQHWWLNVWSDAAAASDVDARFYMTVFFALGAASLVFQVFRAVALVLASLGAARRLHESLLRTVLRLPMTFFDSQPTGRLLNRFTKDVESVDTVIQSSVASFLNCVVSVLWSLVIVVAVSPAVAAALIPLGIAYAAVQKRYIATSRELKRLDSLALSPIFSHFGETLAGLATLRAFRAQPRFADRNAALLDLSNRCYWPAQCINRWLSVRLELLGTGVVFGTAVLVSSAMPTSPGMAGLALTSALSLTGLLNWLVRQSTELEVSMNAVERMIEYEAEPTEAPAEVPERRPLPAWPTQGRIQVENLVVRYRTGLDPVLKGVSFEVRPREKVGVVGRTGSGKSTLMMALYRIVEPSGGRIVIDGIDVSTIGLRDLRSRLALVPQDPVLFTGTFRSNLDPFDAHATDGDAPLWSALERAGLAAAVRASAGGLDAPVAEGGSNLSAGQRQLLCMARALLRHARVLILDEATSSLDAASDAAIQSTIATAFGDRTVLTIAHRLHTIVGSDRVLVLDQGKVSEYGPPAKLMESVGGAFKALVDEASKQMDHSA